MPFSILSSFTIVALVLSSTVHCWWSSRTVPNRHTPLGPLFALQMKEVTVSLQDQPGTYEQRLLEALPANTTVVRWYISRTDDHHAVIEAVIRENSSISHE